MANGMFAGGLGTEDNPYLIEDIEDLSAIRNNPGACYRLISNINMNIYPYNDGAGWDPIDGFYGTLDGDGYVISNLYINRPNRDNVGLFGSTPRTYTSNVFKYLFHNIILDNVDVTGRNNVSALIGSIVSMYMRYSYYQQPPIKMENIFISGKINGTGDVSAVACYPITRIPYVYRSSIDEINNVISRCFINSSSSVNIIAYENNNFTYNPGNGSGATYYYNSVRIDNCLSIDTITCCSQSVSNTIYAKTKCYYLKDNLKLGQYIPNGKNGMTGLSQKEMRSKSYKMFSDLIEAKTTSGDNFFEFDYGCLPTYNHKKHKSVLVEYDGKYHNYDHKNSKWIELDNDDPVYLASNSIKGLDVIPNTSWDEIKDRNPKIVNIVPQPDRYAKNTDDLSLEYSNADSTQLNSSEKCISRTQITFSDNDKFLEQIYT